MKRIKIQDRIINYDHFLQNENGKYYTYLHYTKDTKSLFYVGMGHGKRCVSRASSGRNQWWINIVNNHDFLVEIVDINLTKEEACQKEKELISLYGRKQLKEEGLLVNMTDGGEGGSNIIYSEEDKLKRSEYYKEHPEMWSSGERSKYFGKQLFGENNPNYGNTGKNNPLSKRVVKLDLKGNLVANFSSLGEAAKDAETTSSAISAVCLGKRNQLKGFIYKYESEYSPNFEVKLGKTNKKSVLQLNKEDYSIIKKYESQSATKEDDFIPSEVGKVCLMKAKSHKGYYWSFEDDYDSFVRNHKLKYNKI